MDCTGAAFPLCSILHWAHPAQKCPLQSPWVANRGGRCWVALPTQVWHCVHPSLQLSLGLAYAAAALWRVLGFLGRSNQGSRDMSRCFGMGAGRRQRDIPLGLAWELKGDMLCWSLSHSYHVFFLPSRPSSGKGRCSWRWGGELKPCRRGNTA